MKGKNLKKIVAFCLSAMALEGNAVELTPGGRVHLDYAIHDADLAPLEDKLIVRRARAELEGKINKDWSFQAEYDFTDGGEVKDLYVRYGGWRPGAFTVGQFKAPFGLEELTGSNNITFIERSLPVAAFAPSRRIGAGYNLNRKTYGWAAMAFGPAVGGDEGQGIAGRATYTPLKRDGKLIHLGLALTAEWPDGDVRFRTHPESRPADVRLVRTGRLRNVGRIHQLGLEAAWQSGPLSVQGEWMRANVAVGAGQSDSNLQGGYLAGSWVLSGESRGYKNENGSFRGISPGQRGGAWELAARYSNIDLDDGAVLGGQEDNVTVGLNWYAKNYVRIMGNLIKVNSERRGIADDPMIFLVRVQAAY